MGNEMKYGLYLLMGGLIVSVSTYVGAMGRGFRPPSPPFPAITGMTFILIYLNGGTDNTLSYAKHLLLFVPPWTAYVLFIIYMLPRFGFWPAMVGGLTLYMACVGLLKLTL